MSYYAEMFERANIYDLREFIMYGTQNLKESTHITEDKKTYHQRAEEILIETKAKIQEKYPDSEECEEIMNQIFKYSNESDRIFMEIGLQCGFNLAMQLMENIPREKSND